MFCLNIFDQLVGFYKNNYSSHPHGLWVNSPFGLRSQIEKVQKRVLRILFPEISHRKALEDEGLKTVFHTRDQLYSTLFKQIVESDGQHKLAGLLSPWNNNERYNFRNRHMFSIPCVKPKRFRNSFIMHYTYKQQ